jgi:hypothetical protein
MGELLGKITKPAILSRYINLAVALEMLIDAAVHNAEILLEGTLMGKTAGGKYRAYAQGTVAVGGEFSTGAATFTLEDAAGRGEKKHFRVGDTIESVAGDALGEIASYDPETGVGTLVANSASVLAAGNGVRVIAAELDISDDAVRVLKDERSIEDSQDEPAAGYNEGYFNTAAVKGATPEALVAMGAKQVSASEFRLV